MGEIALVRCKRTDPLYQEIRDRHYVPNRGCHGQQLHYLIQYDGVVIGIISGASSVWAVRARDEFFGLTPQTKRVGLPSIINNVVFRMERHDVANLATQVLSRWRRQIAIDWEERYHVQVHGFETFVVETDYRKGTLYKADNWTYLGRTVGSTKAHKGLLNKSTRATVEPKLVYAKKVRGTTLSTHYESTWRGKSVVLTEGVRVDEIICL